MARMATESGLSPASRVGKLSWRVTAERRSCRHGEPPRRAPPLQKADDGGREMRRRAVPPVGIVDDVGAIERGAEDGSLRHLSAIAAADAAVVDGGDRIVLQRIVRMLDREGRTAGQADAG